MKDKILRRTIAAAVGIIVAVAAGYGYNYLNKPIVPVVNTDGSIEGPYSIASIMTLGKPYRCTFEKGDGSSKIAGVLRTDGFKINGEFRISSPSLQAKEFNSFLIVKDKVAYSWTSLASTGFKGGVAESASVNASPREQAQIVGTRDKIQYKCSPLNHIDDTVFDPPSWITFTEIK
jgi:hypothetical protein